jgi:hypothetical protein
MGLTDIIFWGWYQMLDKTLYLYSTEKGGIGPREHSFFITFLIHGINAGTILRYLLVEYFHEVLSIYFSLPLGILIFTIGYLIYYKGNRINRVISRDVKNAMAVVFILVAVAYAIASVYFMFEVGDYVRSKFNR